jgi:sirohydrochlorin cobaltochelatase
MPGDGILLVGHGTRDARGIAEAQAVARAAAGRLAAACQLAFLELAPPSIAEGLDRLAEEGATRVTVVPLLLFAAGHAKDDIPQAVADAAARRPELAIRSAEPLNCHPGIVGLSALRYEESLAGRAAVPPEESLLLMVGRGSRDPQANAEMARFARLRWERTPVGWHETCYAAMTRPALGEALARVARLGFRRVVVQPHLLFHGELADRVRDEAEQFGRDHPQGEWIVAGHLGYHSLLVDAIVDRTGRASEAPPVTSGR